jgi:uncharacterized protein
MSNRDSNRDKPLVLFHASCSDGFCAAWIYRRYVNPNCEFRAIQYGSAPPNVEGREVIVLDFSFPRDKLLEMHQQARSFLVLDHHKTAAEDLQGLDFCVFDMEKSGARLTWEHFFDPQANGDINMPPWLVPYTEDQDLWLWQLKDSRAINAAIGSYPRLFHIWDQLSSRDKEELALEGRAILRYQDRLVRPRVKNHAWTTIGEYRVPITNSTCLSSEIGNGLAKNQPFGVVFFVTKESKYVYNLRSISPDGVDVGEIAQRYGGGGHTNAAGFTLDEALPMEE